MNMKIKDQLIKKIPKHTEQIVCTVKTKSGKRQYAYHPTKGWRKVWRDGTKGRKKIEAFLNHLYV